MKLQNPAHFLSFKDAHSPATFFVSSKSFDIQNVYIGNVLYTGCIVLIIENLVVF